MKQGVEPADGSNCGRPAIPPAGVHRRISTPVDDAASAANRPGRPAATTAASRDRQMTAWKNNRCATRTVGHSPPFQDTTSAGKKMPNAGQFMTAERTRFALGNHVADLKQSPFRSGGSQVTSRSRPEFCAADTAAGDYAGDMNTPLPNVVRRLRSLAQASDGDALLVQAFVSRHDDDAFAELVRRHGPMVYGVCRRGWPIRTPPRSFPGDFSDTGPKGRRRKRPAHDRAVAPCGGLAGRTPGPSVFGPPTVSRIAHHPCRPQSGARRGLGPNVACSSMRN